MTEYSIPRKIVTMITCGVIARETPAPLSRGRQEATMYHRWIKTALNAVILVGMTAIPASRGRPGRILSLPSKGMTSARSPRR